MTSASSAVTWPLPSASPSSSAEYPAGRGLPTTWESTASASEAVRLPSAVTSPRIPIAPDWAAAGRAEAPNRNRSAPHRRASLGRNRILVSREGIRAGKRTSSGPRESRGPDRSSPLAVRLLEGGRREEGLVADHQARGKVLEVGRGDQLLQLHPELLALHGALGDEAEREHGAVGHP